MDDVDGEEGGGRFEEVSSVSEVRGVEGLEMVSSAGGECVSVESIGSGWGVTSGRYVSER